MAYWRFAVGKKIALAPLLACHLGLVPQHELARCASRVVAKFATCKHTKNETRLRGARPTGQGTARLPKRGMAIATNRDTQWTGHCRFAQRDAGCCTSVSLGWTKVFSSCTCTTQLLNYARVASQIVRVCLINIVILYSINLVRLGGYL